MDAARWLAGEENTRPRQGRTDPPGPHRRQARGRGGDRDDPALVRARRGRGRRDDRLRRRARQHGGRLHRHAAAPDDHRPRQAGPVRQRRSRLREAGNDPSRRRARAHPARRRRQRTLDDAGQDRGRRAPPCKGRNDRQRSLRARRQGLGQRPSGRRSAAGRKCGGVPRAHRRRFQGAVPLTVRRASPLDQLDEPGQEFERPIDGWMSVGDRSIIGGASQSGKSFLAVHAALCIAHDREFFGAKVKSGLVVYQAGEGVRAFKRRLRAWRKHHGVHVFTRDAVRIPAVAGRPLRATATRRS